MTSACALKKASFACGRPVQVELQLLQPRGGGALDNASKEESATVLLVASGLAQAAKKTGSAKANRNDQRKQREFLIIKLSANRVGFLK